MELAVARQAVIQDGVERSAEREQQRQDGKNGEEPYVGRTDGPSIAASGVRREGVTTSRPCLGPRGSLSPALRVSSHARQHTGDRQHQRSNPQVVAALDVILDAPVDRGERLAEGILRHRHDGSLPDVVVSVVRRVAVKIRQQEGNDLARGPGPIAHLLQRRRAFPEALPHQLVQGQDLHAAERYTQADHDQQPGAAAHDRAP